MSTIEKYKNAKFALADAEEWAGLLGKPYAGGGGGVGRVHKIKLEKGEHGAVIYHQPYNGARNYHEIPDSFRPYVERAIAEHFGAILATALKHLRGHVAGLAKEAIKERDQLLADAGLTDAKIEADGGKS